MNLIVSKNKRRNSRNLWFLYLFLSGFAFAQSTKSLEDAVLLGTPPSNPETLREEENPPTGGAIVQESEETGEALVRESVDADDLEAVDEAVVGPKEIPKEHILVVQYRFIKKEGLHEITPFTFGVQPADSFRKQLQFGFGYSYYLSEQFGIEIAQLNFITNLSSGLSGAIRRNTGLETERVEPVVSLGSSLIWVPLHAKSATKEEVYYFEGYVFGGGGATAFETNEWAAMAMFGGGFRSYLSKRAVLKTEVRDYVDFRDGIDHRVNFILGASILLGAEK